MVDVGGKSETARVARAAGSIFMKPETLALIQSGSAKKGDVLGIARIAAIQAAKRTGDLIPLCHPIALTRVTADFTIDVVASAVHCQVSAECHGRTGVEMEALVGVSAALLTVWDMVKSAEKDDKGQYPVTRIDAIRVVEKVKGFPGAQP